MVFGHLAVHCAAALVAQLLAYRTLEEALATLAADGAIMATGSTVPAHQAQLYGRQRRSGCRRAGRISGRNGGCIAAAAAVAAAWVIQAHGSALCKSDQQRETKNREITHIFTRTTSFSA